MQNSQPLRVGILGAGGLGQAAIRLLARKREMRLVAVADSKGIAFRAEGLDPHAVLTARTSEKGVAATPHVGFPSKDPLGEVLARGEFLDGIFLALPNLPNDFIPSVVERFAAEGYHGVLVDALKRTSAVERLLKLDAQVREASITYIVGAGATPGLLTAAAHLAAQSFVTIESVEIWFGVGIDHWETYRATVREDLAHLPGFDVERVARMSEDEIAAELDRRNGILELRNMEHADDILLERAGVVERSRVSVGGVVDTRNPRKPVSTRVRVTGTTFEGKQSSHVFTLGDETSMAANVCGPVLGYMKTGVWLHERGVYGILTSAEVMPQFVR